MAWLSENRSNVTLAADGPFLTDELKSKLRDTYLPRYPTKRAVLLPAFHLIQHQYNWIPMKAVQEVAEFLEVSPAEALDTASFYEEFWLRPKGKYLIGVCRSLACHLCGNQSITEHLKKKFQIEPTETSSDGRVTLIEMECLGACGTAPVALVNEALHENLTIESLDQILAGLPENPHDYHDPTITWNDTGH